MDDLISRQAAINAIYNCTDIFVGNLPILIDKDEAYKALANVPSVDAVEVVRCKDCKHCGYSPTHNQYWCEGKQVFAEHYCSRGERKPDETNR